MMSETNNSVTRVDADVSTASTFERHRFRDNFIINVTSTRFSRHRLLKAPASGLPLQIGDVIHFVIQSRDGDDKPQTHGGDFWTGALSGDASKKAYTAGRVTDFNNGTYLMTFVLAWSGMTRVDINLVYPSRVTHWMRTKFRADDHTPTWHGTFRRGKVAKNTNCFLTYETVPHNFHGSMCEYRNTVALTNTRFFCRKPSRFECDNLVQHRNVLPYGKITADIMRRDRQDIFEG